MILWNTLYAALLGFMLIASSANAQIQWRSTGPSEAVVDITSSQSKSIVLTKGGLYASTDDKSWQKLKSIPASEIYNSVVALPGGELFLFGYNFYSTSTDGGTTWKKVTQTGFSTRRCISDNEGNMYAGQNDPIMRSTDKGVTWQESKQGTSGAFFDIAVFAIAPNGDIYAGNQGITGGMVYRSSDHGNNWSLVHSESMNDVRVITIKNGSIWIAYSNKLIYSDDDGVTWNTRMNTPYAFTSLLFTGENEALAGMTSVGLFSTADRCNGWFSNMSGIHGRAVNKLLVSPKNNIFCGTDSGLFYSAAPANDVKEPLESSKIILTPNPARNEVYVRNTISNVSGAEYELYDLLGRKLMSVLSKTDGENFLLNTESLQNGIYYVSVRLNDKIITSKLIISK